MIKLSKLFFAFSLLFVLSSCGDDDEPQTATDELLGTWSAIAFSANVESSSEFGGMTTTSVSDVLGSNLNYEVTFTETAFTTSGSYDINTTTTAVGQTFTNEQSLTGVMGSGTYTTDGNVMTIDGQFFELMVDGVDLTAMSEAQMTNYEINSDGELVFTQNETMETTDSGATTTSTIISSSTWVKQ